jgi:hypothetical protein
VPAQRLAKRDDSKRALGRKQALIHQHAAVLPSDRTHLVVGPNSSPQPDPICRAAGPKIWRDGWGADSALV